LVKHEGEREGGREEGDVPLQAGNRVELPLGSTSRDEEDLFHAF